MAGRHLGEAGLRQGVGGALGPQVTGAIHGGARDGEQDDHNPGHVTSRGLEPYRRDHDALLQQLARTGGHAARRHAADVGVVGAAGDQEVVSSH